MKGPNEAKAKMPLSNAITTASLVAMSLAIKKISK